MEQETETTDAFLQRMELELVKPVILRRLKRRYANKASLLTQSDRFTITNRGNELKAAIRSKAYAELEELRDYYDILGVREEATDDQIEAAYQARGNNRYCHEAYETLIDPARRSAYDAKLDELEQLFIKQVSLPSFRAVPLGGGREVGRSSFYVRVGTHYVLIDAGIKMQGQGQEPLYPRLDVLDQLPKIDAVFVSHVHADHIAALNRVPPEVPIYMTETNVKQLEFLSKDYVNKESWTEDEKKDVLARCVGTDSGAIGDLTFRFVNAGHVPGSTMVFLKAGDDSVLYTGDINFEETQFETAAKPVGEKVEALFIEGTYAGQAARTKREAREADLVETVAQAIIDGEKVLIPAFAVGRTAEVVKILDDAIDKGLVPKVNAYTVGQGAGLMKKLQLAELRHFAMVGAGDEEKTGQDGDRSVKPVSVDMVKATYDFKKMMAGQGSIIIVGGSGFADNGVAGQLVSSSVSMQNALVLLTGYQAPGSTGDILLRASRGERVPLPGTNGEFVKVLCDVKQVGLSAHASEEMLRDFINKQNPENIYLIHIDPDKVEALSESLHRRNVAPANLQVTFDYAHPGVRLMPYNDEESSVNALCSCGMKFASLPTATRHAQMEGHKLVMDAMWYYFSYLSTPDVKPKDIKGSFYNHLPNPAAVTDLFVNGASFVAEGKLTPEETKAIETSMNLAGRAPIVVKFVKSVAIPIASINYPLSIANITERMNALLGAHLDTPVWRVRRLHPGIAGEYLNPPRNLLLVNRMTTDEEDFAIVMTHEIAHYFQLQLNPNLPAPASNPTDLQNSKLFVEGFAQYITLKLGGSRKLISLAHERGDHIPSHYVLGRIMFEDIEAVYGIEKAISIGLHGTPAQFISLHAGTDAETAAKNSIMVSKVIDTMKTKGIWLRTGLFSTGIPRDVRRAMWRYAAENAASVIATEFTGWEPDKVVDEAIMLCMADYLNSSYGLGIPRDDVKLSLKFILNNDEQFPSVRSRVLQRG